MKITALSIFLLLLCSTKLSTQNYSNKRHYYYLIDAKGHKVMPDTISTYDKVKPFRENLIESPYYEVRYKKKSAVIDSVGTLVIPFLYEDIGFYSDSMLSAIYKNKKYGFFDINGKEVVPYQYDNFRYRTNYGEVCIVAVEKNINGKLLSYWGAVNLKTYKEIIPCIYTGISAVESGFVIVSKDKKCGIISKTGKIILPITYGKIAYKGKALGNFIYNVDNTYCLIDPVNEKVLLDNMDYICDYGATDITYVKKGDKYAFINKKGEYLTQFIFDDAKTCLYGGGIGIKVDAFSYLNSLGNEIMIKNRSIYEHNKDTLKVYKGNGDSIEYYNLKGALLKTELNKYRSTITEVRFLVANDKYLIGYKDVNDKLIIPYQYMYGSDFNKGLAIVTKTNMKSGVIDINNKEVIPFEYDDLEFTNRDKLLLKKNGSIIFADRTGKPVSKQIYNKVDKVEGAFYKALRDAKWTLVTPDGNEIIPCVYDNINYSSEKFSTHELYTVQQNGKKGLIDAATGEEYLPCVYDDIRIKQGNNEGIHVKYNGKWGLFSLGRQLLSDPLYDEQVKLTGKNKSLIIAKKNGLYGIIDLVGQIRVPFTNINIEPYYNLFIVTTISP